MQTQGLPKSLLAWIFFFFWWGGDLQFCKKCCSKELGGSDGKKYASNAGDTGLIPGLGSWEDPLEKGMPTHSSVLAWRILWTEEPGGLQSIASQKVKQSCEAKFKNPSLTLMHNPVYFYLCKILNHLEFFLLIFQDDLTILGRRKIKS